MPRYIERQVKNAGKLAGRDWKFGGLKLVTKKQPGPALDQTTLPPYIEALKRDATKEITRLSEGRTRREEGLSIEIAELKKRIIQLKQEALLISQDAMGQPPSITPKIYYIILAVLSISEFAINTTAFQILSQSWPLTILMAMFLLVGFPLVTHFTGSSIRQNKNWAGLWIVLPVSFLTFLGIAITRAYYFEAAKAQHLLGVSVSPLVLTIITIIFNSFLFIVATIAAFQATPENKQAYFVFKELQEKEIELASAIEAYNKLIDKKEAVMKMIVEGFERLCFVFDFSNQRAREAFDPGQPEWVKHIPKLDVPMLKRLNQQRD